MRHPRALAGEDLIRTSCQFLLPPPCPFDFSGSLLKCTHRLGLLQTAGYRPRLIVSEASPAWIPPLRFRMNHNDGDTENCLTK